MRCLIFIGENALKTVDAFNKWAEGKYMTKDVIIHSHIIQPLASATGGLMVVVFFDEGTHPSWVGKQ